jgi:putative AbiEi antitoxin of type IV toxin-antitoxin system
MAQLSSNGGAIARRNKTVDVRVADLATTQHRVVEYSQLWGIGLSPDAIRHRVRRGRLHPIHRGVYAVGHRDIGRDCSVLSHRTAADQRVWRQGPVSRGHSFNYLMLTIDK